MPAAVDDPASPTIYRVSGQAPFPDPGAPLAVSIVPRKVTLRDRQTVATILPIVSAQHQVPASLITYLCGQINREIEGGDTYPMMEAFTPAGFAAYWFQNFGAVMLLGDFASADAIPDSRDWARDCLGSFYIKPNYPGRSSHVCNGGLLVTDASRNRGVGRLMGESYIDWAPRLGYTYSVFNLVYETNVASCRIWDALGFKRIGRVKGCGNLRSHPDRLVDAIIYGRDLPPPRDPSGDPTGDGGGDGVGGSSSFVLVEERFDKIRYYLKVGRYPDGADRAEKSRLRSAATHYKLLDDGETLMLKDKLVVSDPARQYEIARETHSLHHGGINKTTAIIAEKYHWSRIKETVSDVIRLCKECKELAKAPSTNGNNGVVMAAAAATTTTTTTTTAAGQHMGASRAAASKPTTPIAGVKRSRSPSPSTHRDAGPRSSPPRSVPEPSRHHAPCLAATVVDNDRVLGLRTNLGSSSSSSNSTSNSTLLSSTLPSAVSPLLHEPGPYANPSDISVVRPSQTTLHHHGDGFLHTHPSGVQVQAVSNVYQPIDPQIMNHGHGDNDNDVDQGIHAFDGYHPHADFQALLHATEDDAGGPDSDERRAAVDRDLEMLIEHDEDDGSAAAAAVVVLLGRTGKVNGNGGGGGGAGGGGGSEEGVGGQADADMDDLDDSILRDTRGWT